MPATSNRKEYALMDGISMGFAGIWMILILLLVDLAISALIKYLQK